MVSFTVRLKANPAAPFAATGPRVTFDVCGALRSFLGACVGYPAGHLYIAAPFWSDGFLEELSRTLVGSVEKLTVFCASVRTAQLIQSKASGLFRFQVEARFIPKLHGKLYIFRPSRGAIQVCVGSQNATGAGLRTNLEFGVHMEFSPATPEAVDVEDLLRFLYRTSVPLSQSQLHANENKETSDDFA